LAADFPILDLFTVGNGITITVVPERIFIQPVVVKDSKELPEQFENVAEEST
jgi:hypothetical protein